MGDLTHISSEVLRRTVEMVRQRDDSSAQVTATQLSAAGLAGHAQHLMSVMGPFSGSAWLVIIESVLAERVASKREPPELVWTGPTRTKHPRSTPVVIRSLIDEAKSHILLTVYSYVGAAEFFEHLEQALERGVTVDMFLNLEQPKTKIVTSDEIDRQMNKFLTAWGDRSHQPDLFYDARFKETTQYFSLHAKCLVIDESAVFIGSANLTERGTERNIEAGVLYRDAGLARRVAAEFRSESFEKWTI